MLLKIQSADEPGSILGAIFNHFPADSDGKWNILIGFEAFLAVLISSIIAMSFAIPQAGLASIALACAAIVPRVNQIQRVNRDRIWELGMSGWAANRKSIISVTILFIGMVLAYAVVGLVLPQATLQEQYTFIMDRGTAYTSTDLSPERFAHGMTFLRINTYVLIVFFIFAFIYRGLGTSMALGWNAGVWAITLVTAVKVNMAASASPVLLAVIATAALSPHVLLEGLAYLCGSLAAIFFSRGITLYKPTDSRFFKVLNAVIVLAVISFGLVIVGAVVEHFWAPFMLGFL
ncbi:MAG: hypothetical protein ACJ0BG_03800 [Dehalococcoidia bacterium]|jgi:hypothetical protein|tara:strand:- start:1319 stop:2188 length:870 start_codon:yes stop_codon:yes gene_type:complete